MAERAAASLARNELPRVARELAVVGAADFAERVAPRPREHAVQGELVLIELVRQSKRDKAGAREREAQRRMLARELILQGPLGPQLSCGKQKPSRHAVCELSKRRVASIA